MSHLGPDRTPLKMNAGATSHGKMIIARKTERSLSLSNGSRPKFLRLGHRLVPKLTHSSLHSHRVWTHQSIFNNTRSIVWDWPLGVSLFGTNDETCVSQLPRCKHNCIAANYLLVLTTFVSAKGFVTDRLQNHTDRKTIFWYFEQHTLYVWKLSRDLSRPIAGYSHHILSKNYIHATFFMRNAQKLHHVSQPFLLWQK